MTSTIDIHPANADEQLAAYRNVHEVWGGDAPLDAFVERRLASLQHNRAAWWVLTVTEAGQAPVVAASLGCYPLHFGTADGEHHTGFGFGAVHTRPEHRRRGLADRLCREVIRVRREQGDRFAVLFSDIDPGYYARMGFVRTATRRWRASDLHTLAHSGPVARLKRVEEPERRIRTLNAAYAAHHAADPVHLRRPAEYWRYSLTKYPDDLFLSVDGNQGYLRVSISPEHGGVHLIEVALKDPDRSAAALRGLAHYALDFRTLQFISGWARPPKALRTTLFTSTPLTRAIPMIVDLSGELGEEQLAQTRLWSSDHF